MKILDLINNAKLLIPTLQLFCAIRDVQPSTPAVGVCLEGDSSLRLKGAIALFRSGMINSVIVSGGIDDPTSDNLIASSMKDYLVNKGIPVNAIEVEERSKVTHDHPIYVNQIIRRHGYKDVIIITSGYHLIRAYLRFLKEVSQEEYPYNLYGYPVGTIETWFQRSPTENRIRFNSFYQDELTKIRTYKGLASFDDAWRYIQSLQNKVQVQE